MWLILWRLRIAGCLWPSSTWRTPPPPTSWELTVSSSGTYSTPCCLDGPHVITLLVEGGRGVGAFLICSILPTLARNLIERSLVTCSIVHDVSWDINEPSPAVFPFCCPSWLSTCFLFCLCGFYMLAQEYWEIIKGKANVIFIEQYKRRFCGEPGRLGTGRWHPSIMNK